MKDFYQILGVARNASKDDIKKAYRNLAHKYHPDKKGGDETRFKEINEAYHTLTDDQKRAQYDRFGNTFDQTSWGGDFSGWPGFEDLGGNMHEIFEDFFGFGMGGRGAKRGRDISLDLEVSFEEAVFGTRRRVLLRKLAACDICAGSGVAPGAKEHTCTRCQGSGTIHTTKKSLFGSITRLTECATCRGRGKVPEKKCDICQGVGTLPKSGEVFIDVPAGIQDGEMIRLEGEGEAPTARGGDPGDLYARVHVRPHKTLKRMGRDLLMKLDIPLTEALLGSEREIETLDGKIKIKIPAGISEGETLSVRGKGVPTTGRGGMMTSGRERGDLLIEAHVQIPKKLSGRAKKLIEELRNEGL